MADMFASDYEGGAELSLESIIESCPFEITRKKCIEVNKNFIDDHLNDFWIFGNFANISKDLIVYLIQIHDSLALF